MRTASSEQGLEARTLVLVVAPFVVAGVLSAAAFDADYDIRLALWQGVVGWPIGAVLLVGPVAMAGLLHDRRLYVGTLVLIAAVGVASITLVSLSDDAQAGIGFLYAPVLGCVVAGVAIAAARVMAQRRRTRDGAAR